MFATYSNPGARGSASVPATSPVAAAAAESGKGCWSPMAASSTHSASGARAGCGRGQK